MRKKSAKIIQSEKALPSINKVRANTNATRKTSTKQFEPLSLSPRIKILKRPLVVDTSPTTARGNQITQNLQNKLSGLREILENRNSKIDVLEYECLQINPSFNLRTFGPVASGIESRENEEETLNHLESVEVYREYEEGLGKDEASRNKYKDLEIFRLRKKAEEGALRIEKLSRDNQKYLSKLEQYQDALDLADDCEVEMNSIKSACHSEVHRIYQNINEKEVEICEKTEETQELAELIRRSEEKRFSSNEYNIYIESTAEKLKARISALQQLKEKILKKLMEVQEKIRERELIIYQLSIEINDIQLELGLEKQKNISMFLQYEEGEKAIGDSLNQYENDRIAFKEEIGKLEAQLVDVSIDSDASEKKGYKNILAYRHLYSSLNQEENSKHRGKIFTLENQISEVTHELEKLKKNEIYLKNQLLTKDLIISQIEKLLKKREEGVKIIDEKGKNEGAKRLSDINELMHIIKPWGERFEELKESISCIGCKAWFKADFKLIDPCGHIVCYKCKEDLQGKCLKCQTEVKGFIESHSIQILVSSVKIEFDFLRKAQKFLNQLKN